MEFQIYYEVETNSSHKGFRPLPMSAFSKEVQANIIKEIEKVLKEGGDDINCSEFEGIDGSSLWQSIREVNKKRE